MAKRKYTAKTTTNDMTIMQWLLLALTVVFFFVAPFEVALFNGRELDFERPIYQFQVWGAIALLLLSIHWFFRWKLEEHKDFALLAVWLIPISYIISLTSAASLHQAVKMVYISVMYTAAFFIALELGKNEKAARLLQKAWIFSAYTVVMFGFLNWFGHAHYQDAAQQTNIGIRLTSVFQYANTYAAFLIAALLGGLFNAITCKNKWEAGLHRFLLVPILISFFLTLSRGGLLVLPLVFLCILLFFSLKRQIPFIVHTVIALIGALLVLKPVTSIGTQLQNEASGALAFQGWLWLILASAVSTVILYLFERFVWPMVEKRLERWDQTRFAHLFLPVLAVIGALVLMFLLFGTSAFKNLLPSDIAERIENINFQQHSVLERISLFKDAMKLIEDYPVFGAGGGAWQTLFLKYQSNPYTVSQAHNFFLQHLAEVGLFGFSVLAFILLYVGFVYIREYLRASKEKKQSYFVFFIISLSILVHSIIDFNMSYVYIAVLVFFSLGMLAASGQTPKTDIAEKWNASRWKGIYPAACAIVAVVVAYQSVQFVTANHSFYDALGAATGGQSGKLKEVLEPLDRAMELHPSHSEYPLQKINFLRQVYAQTKDERLYEQARELAKQLRQTEPHNLSLYLAEYDLFMAKGETEKALKLANRAKQEYPWFLEPFEQSILLHFALGEQAWHQGNTEMAIQHWDGAFSVHQEILHKMEELKKLPEGQLQGRPFTVTAKMSAALGKIHFYRGEYEAALPFLKAGFQPQLETEQDQDAAIWYLAALRKLGQDDPALYEALDQQVSRLDRKIEEKLNLQP